jgi:hypothetical protein
MKKKKTHVNRKNDKRDERVVSLIDFRNFLPFLAIFILFWCGCSAKTEFRCDATGTALPWTHTKFLNDASEFQFAILADRAGGTRRDVFVSAVDKLNLLQPEFVMCVGDMVNGNTGIEEEKLITQWGELEEDFKKLEAPFFYLPGNHDISGETGLKLWKQRHGRPYYHFIYKNVLFLCMDSQGGDKKCEPETLSRDQVDYFKKVLASNRQVRWTLVFIHRPLWNYSSIAPVWAEIETALGDRPYTVFAGHEHLYAYQVRQGHKYIIMATTGGGVELNRLQAERGDMIRLGNYDHFAWVTMTDKGPKIANLTLDGIYDEQVTSAETAKLAEQLNGRRNMMCIFVQSPGSPDIAEGQLSLINDTSASMTITGHFETQEGITVNPAQIDDSLSPGEEKNLDFTLKGLSHLPSGKSSRAPAEFKGTVTFLMPGFHPITKSICMPISAQGPK